MRIAYIGIRGCPRKRAPIGCEAIVAGWRAGTSWPCTAGRRVVPPEGPFPRCRADPHAGAARQSMPMRRCCSWRPPCTPVLRRRFDLIHLHNVEATFVLRCSMPLPGRRDVAWAGLTGGTSGGGSGQADDLLTDWPFVRLGRRGNERLSAPGREYSGGLGRQVLFIPNGVGTRTRSGRGRRHMPCWRAPDGAWRLPSIRCRPD